MVVSDLRPGGLTLLQVLRVLRVCDSRGRPLGRRSVIGLLGGSCNVRIRHGAVNEGLTLLGRTKCRVRSAGRKSCLLSHHFRSSRLELLVSNILTDGRVATARSGRLVGGLYKLSGGCFHQRIGGVCSMGS